MIDMKQFVSNDADSLVAKINEDLDLNIDATFIESTENMYCVWYLYKNLDRSLRELVLDIINKKSDEKLDWKLIGVLMYQDAVSRNPHYENLTYDRQDVDEWMLYDLSKFTNIELI